MDASLVTDCLAHEAVAGVVGRARARVQGADVFVLYDPQGRLVEDGVSRRDKHLKRLGSRNARNVKVTAENSIHTFDARAVA